MTKLKVLLRSILTLYVTITLVFVALAMLRGSPADVYSSPKMTPQLRLKLETMYATNQPMAQQYIAFMKNMFSGSFGYSFHHRTPVNELIGKALSRSIFLGLLGLLLAAPMTLMWLMGMHLSKRKWIKTLSKAMPAFLLAFPTFLLGLIAITVFGLYLGWFPAFGHTSLFDAHLSFWQRLVDRFHHALLPASCIAASLAARFTTYLDHEMVGLDNEPYILAARGRGVSDFSLFFKHKLFGLTPYLIQLLGLYFPVLVSGTLVLEFLFGWNGMGTLVFDAVATRDFPVLLGCTFVISCCAILSYQMAEWYRNRLISRTFATEPK